MTGSVVSPIETEDDAKSLLQCRRTNATSAVEVPPIVRKVLNSAGRPMDSNIRDFMGTRFRHNFSSVRIHTDTLAAASAHAVQADAYTVGNDVIFSNGSYRPTTTKGKKLLAHELTHVVQQADRPVSSGTDISIGSTTSIQEQEADSWAAALSVTEYKTPLNLSPVPPSLQRACGPTAIGTPTGCTGSIGDITDYGGSSDRIFRFRVNCDDFLPGEEARLRTIARRDISPTDTVDIDGFASEEGDPTFNDHLSCARALKVANIVSLESGATVNLFKHGATPGLRGDRRSAVISIQSPAPAPPSCNTPTGPDLSGRASNPTPFSELTVAAMHPIDAFTARDLASDAFAAASRSGLVGPHLGPQDAFRHCFWNCCMTQELSAARAEQFATGHENSGPSAIPFDNQMDLHNNATGRLLGASPGTNCEAACLLAVTSGRLRTIRGPHTRPLSPVTTDCIGPSDQPWP